MPELPEVETVCRQLSRSIRGKYLCAHKLFDSRLVPLPLKRCYGSEISSVYRSGKQIVIELERGSRGYIVVHLRMTGQLLWLNGGSTSRKNISASSLPKLDDSDLKRLRASFTLKSKSKRGRSNAGVLHFLDTRRFGTIGYFRDREDFVPTGKEPLDPSLSVSQVAQSLSTAKQPIKTWLLRQDRLVGIGNIYASEICFDSRIDPRRSASSLTEKESARLLVSIRKILNKAIEHCGTTFSDFGDSYGDEGTFQRFLKVYDRAGQPCRKCKTPIKRLVQQQRSTYYCPSCQR